MIYEELLNLKIKDQFVKNELIYSMQCMIHQYAKTEEDIKRLEEMINLKTIIEERSPVLDSMKREGEKIGRKEGEKIGRKEGEKIGRKEGEKIGEERGEKRGEKKGILKVLNDLEKDVDKDIVEKLAKKYGYTKEDILNSK